MLPWSWFAFSNSQFCFYKAFWGFRLIQKKGKFALSLPKHITGLFWPWASEVTISKWDICFYLSFGVSGCYCKGDELWKFKPHNLEGLLGKPGDEHELLPQGNPSDVSLLPAAEICNRSWIREIIGKGKREGKIR